MCDEQKKPIKVVVRIRPSSDNGQDVSFQALLDQNALVRLKDGIPVVEGQTYLYDQVFDENATTSEVYESVVRDLINNVLKGKNITIIM